MSIYTSKSALNILTYFFNKMDDENYHLYTETRTCILNLEKEIQEHENNNKNPAVDKKIKNNLISDT